ncbi:MAG: hypothetical protein J7M18_01365 [Candidatus Eremiobacteraeota bacterium]|nr:hypothetical protein [Candidatus Eremiobacteraeota bacterium]
MRFLEKFGYDNSDLSGFGNFSPNFKMAIRLLKKDHPDVYNWMIENLNDRSIDISEIDPDMFNMSSVNTEGLTFFPGVDDGIIKVRLYPETEKENPGDYAETILHELRHAWQAKEFGLKGAETPYVIQANDEP